MFAIARKTLTRSDRERHEKILGVEESEASLRRKRMWVSFQLFGLMIGGVTVSFLTYVLWTGGPARLIDILPGTAGTAVLCLVVFTLLSGRAAKRDLSILMDLKAESRRALAAEHAETATLDLDRETMVIRHGDALWLVTEAKSGGAAVVKLSADPTLADMFRQPTPPLRHISWLQDPDTGAISHAMQLGLPPGDLDRVDIAPNVDSAALQKALGAETGSPVTLTRAAPADLRAAIVALAAA